MAYFQKTFNGINLYTGQQPAGDRGFTAFVIPGSNVAATGIELEDALTNTTYAGVFVFSAITPTLTADTAPDFVKSVLALTKTNRCFIWLTDPTNIVAATTSILPIASDGSAVSATAILQLATGLSLNVTNGMGITLDDTTITFTGSSGTTMFLSGTESQLQTTQAFTANLYFAGAEKGCIQFGTFIMLSSLHNYLQWGFQFLYPGEKEPLAVWMPFATATPTTDSIGFTILIDPSDVYNKVFDTCTSPVCNIADAYNSRRTYFNFLGKNVSGTDTLLNSNYASTYGATVNLVPATQAAAGTLPARFVITEANINTTNTTEFLFSPEGDFTVQLPTVTNAINNNLLCGVNATEFFTITPQGNPGTGDVVRFVSRKPAFAPLFPFTQSVSAPPGDATTLLTSDFTTSWATIISNASPAIQYISQPHGASLYAVNQDVFVGSKDPLLGFYPSAIAMVQNNTTITAPFVPYGEMQAADAATCQLLEQQIISPVRKTFLNKNIAPPAATTAGAAPTILQTTSPQGLYINVNTSGNNQWTLLQLAANEVEEMQNGQWVNTPYQLQFTNLPQLLQSAFQTNQLFLVMSCINADTASSFTGNEMSIEGWPFKFQIPTANPNGIFNNVLIFKFIKNTSLVDLVTTPQQWAMKDDFNYTADSSGLNNLVSWLSGYIASGCNRFTVNGDTDYAKFNTIATDPNWQGIIGLNVNIDLGDFPEQLQGLLAGIDLTRFNAHHFGIDINNVQLSGGNLAMQNNSSLFGLIDYEDVVFESLNYSVTKYQQQAPIDTSSDYAFRVLSLKVLFENSKITNFGSYLALTINELFGESIKTDNRQNLLIFQGNYEDHNGFPVYTFTSIPASSQQVGSSSDYMLFANSIIINDVEIASATFNTLVSQASGNQSSIVNSVFTLNGYINFYPLTGFDLLSYGCEAGPVVAGQGLCFSSMNIDFSFPLATPLATTFKFDISQMSFDPVQSYSRLKSVVTNFPIQITGIVSSDTSPTPASQGFLNVQLPSLQQKQAVGTKWYGLQYNLNMGTFGALTGALGFNTTLLVLWNVGATGAAAALKLPGVNPQAPFFSLQGVIKISIGNIQLVLADGTDSTYLMKINNIALKLLSLSFPPGGNVNFFLFGNPNGASAPQSVGWYTGYLQKS
jgi:hypothetical protein